MLQQRMYIMVSNLSERGCFEEYEDFSCAADEEVRT